VAVAPVGRPVAENVTALEYVPLIEAALMVNCAVPPGLMLCSGVVTVIVKSAEVAFVPVPVSVAVCGEPVALSATLSVAEKLVVDAGVKVTEIVQVASAVSVEPQVFAEMAKSVGFVPVMVTPVIVSVAVPVLVRMVEIAVAVDPTTVLGKGIVVTESDAPGANKGVPVPVSVTVCGEPVALSATLSDAEKLVAEAGVKVTEMEHVANAVSVLPQVLAEIAKSDGFVPVMVMPLMFSVALPVLVRMVEIAVAVAATVVLGKGIVVTESEAPGAVPVPVSVAVCGEPVALSATLSDAEKLVAEAGVKVTEIVHVFEVTAGSVAPQVLAEMAKSVGFVPVMVMPLMFSVALPVLVSMVEIAVAVDPTAVFGKGIVVTESEAPGADKGVPVPPSVIVCVEAATFRLLSVSTSEPVRLPVVAGVKLMGRMQVVFAASDPADEEVVTRGQAVLPVLVRLKLVPERFGSLPVPGMGSVSAAVPMFSSVTVCGLSLLVLPTTVDAKLRVGAVARFSFTTSLLVASAI